MEVVFGYCDGLIPVRSFIDKGQGIDGRPHNIWIEASGAFTEKMATFANWAAREGAAVYVIPGTVAAAGQAKAAEVLQMQAVVVDIDTGDIAAKRAHLERHLGPPTMVVESGGITPEGQRKAHVWWKLTEPAEGTDIARVTRLRGEIAAKVGGDMHFRSAHQPIRVAGSVYYKNSLKTQVQIVALNADHERDLGEFIEAVADMPPAPGVNLAPDFTAPDKPRVDEVLVTPVREGGMTGHEGHDHGSIAPGHDPVMLAEAQAALRDVLGADTTFGPAAFAGNAAVLPWAIAGEAGRAFLRQEAGGWSVILLSGESLRFAATFRVLGMSPRLAAELEASIAAIEADLDGTQRVAHDAFVGTLMLVDG